MFTYGEISIRALEEVDLPLIKGLRNDPSTWIYLTDIHMLTSRGQIKWYENLLGDPKRTYFIVLDHFQEDTRPIGMVRCDEIDHLNRSMRIGVDILPSCRGKGYGTKTYLTLLNYCFHILNMNRVWLQVLDFNEVGIRMYKNVGFTEEGRLRQAIYRNGKYCDYIIMSILRSEYIGESP